MSFREIVKSNSYVAEAKQKKNKPSPYRKSTALSMDDVMPTRRRRNVANTSTTNETSASSSSNGNKGGSSAQWLESWPETTTTSPIKQNINDTPKQIHRQLSDSSERFDEKSPRTRESTNNSLSFVKTTNATAKFEDLKSEAMNLWDKGVDIELDSNSNTKKKSGWLSQDAFFIDPEPTEPPPQHTYAEAVDNKTPAWAVHNEIKQQKNTQPIMAVPSSYIPMPTLKDTKLLQFLSTIKPDDRQGLNKLKKRIDTILNHELQDITLRTFKRLLNALTWLMEYENQNAEVETARKIHNVWPSINSNILRYIQFYVQLPADLLAVLKFINVMVRVFTDTYEELPKNEILGAYEDMKQCDDNNEMLKLLVQLQFVSPENDQWLSNQESLPDVPDAEQIITEVIQKVNVLEEYEAKKNLPISNSTNEPWVNMDLTRYILVHFMLLRDEVVGPVQKVIKELFKGKNLSEIQVPECAIYEKTSPISTTFMVSSAEPCVVFKLGTPRSNDQLMEDMKEGSLVILLSENIPTRESRLTTKKKIAEYSMMGHVVRASSSYSQRGDMIRMVSVHINKDELAKLDWNGRYTMISTKLNNASTMSTLSWLHDQSLELDKERFSFVLTPRLLGAKNVLTKEQLDTLDSDFYDQFVSTNDDPVPLYLQGADIDISAIMAKNGHYQARPHEDVWPCLPQQWDNVSPSKRPQLYSLSPSQLTAFKFALTRRVACISGASGTGKTHLAGKLAHVISDALRAGQFHQPILVLAKSQSTLDQILSDIVRDIPDMIRFGCEPYIEALSSKQATKLATPSYADPNYRQYTNLEHRLLRNQSKLLALFKARYQVKHHDPSVLSTTVPPAYSSVLTRASWASWAQDDTYKMDDLDALFHAQWVLENAYLKHSGHGLMPIMEPSDIRNRFGWVANNPSYVLSISDATNWPFETSKRTGTDLRVSLLNVWKQVSAEQVWRLSQQEKQALIGQLEKVLVSFIDSEIEDLMHTQTQISTSFDEILIGKLTYLCRFNRVIGMTSDFAAAHQEWVSTLWPRAVIVDEASDMLESTLVSSLVGPRTEHVILLGTSENKPRIIHSPLSSRALDVSLFERWKTCANEFALLEEQWYMHSQVADVIDKFNSKKLEQSALLITAPMASCSENMVDKRNNETMYGISQRAFYLEYNPGTDESRDEMYSRYLKTPITQAEVDEARFVAFFAVYLSQQPYHTTSISILTLSLLQKYLIRYILRDEVPKRTCFKSQVSKINLDVVEQYVGRHDNFCIVSTATPGYSFSHYDNLSSALTRARYGLFVIGKPQKDKVHDRWNDFAAYMQDRDLYGPSIQLTCHAHGDTLFAGHWTDFNKVKNGGCTRRCDTLMSDGHVCKEDCHFLSHDEIVCQEPCIRMRPSNCPHPCNRKCFECARDDGCPPCMVESERELQCGHVYRDVCHKLMHLDLIKCKELVDVELACGHVMPVECFRSSKTSHVKCTQKTVVQLECGHSVVQQCGVETICAEICQQTLECGHKCNEICGVEHTHERKNCTASCPKQLICGHQCAKGCANPDEHTERCLERCNYKCSHEYKCSRECWRDCIRCISDCPYKCKHYKCSKKCYEICDRPPCNEACKKILGCYHQCPGLCGEPCPPCKICNPDLDCSISLRTLSEFDADEKVYMLPECGCVYSVESLDMYFENQAKNGAHTAIKLWDCPKCKKTIYTALRYNRYIKTEIALVNEIKQRMEKERQRLTHHEIKQIISAMNSETRSHAIHNIVGGRWFVCPNQHPYYVGDCGGATELSKCPECNESIGGVEHRVVETNRFYGEFDGSEKPAWPGQPGAKE